MKKKLILLLFLLTAMASAVGLDGRIVILLVSEHRSGDPKMEAVKARLLETRKKMGFSKEDMPIVFMGFEDSDTEREYFDRLGFQAFDSPVLCVAEWGNPARFGPKKVVDYAISRGAAPEHVDFIVDSYLKATGRSVDPVAKPSPSPSPDTGPSLEIITVRFEASGKPLYLTNAGVRIRNNSEQTLRDVTIRFYSKLQESDSWRLMGKKTLEKIPAGYFATRDIVGDTREYGIVDENKNAIKCLYRVEIEYQGNVISEEGLFIPSEGPVGSVLR